jgi:glutamine amidotransferase
MIVIVDYGIGNLGSIANMFKKVGAPATISSDAAVVESADKVVLPGVGSFDRAMRQLLASGLIPTLEGKVRSGTPLLGVCLGMQLLARGSEEGALAGLGWIDASVVHFRPTNGDGPRAGLKVPHMGWNVLHPAREHPLLVDIGDEPRFYFVHSYHVVCDDPATALGHADYGGPFVAAIAQENVLGVQFHPEKSHRFGTQLLRNFAERV